MTKQKNDDNSSNENHWRSLYNAWQKSGLSQAAFCKNNDVNYANFIYWRRKFDRDKSRSKTLIPVNIKPSSNTLTDIAKVDIYFPHNLRLSIPVGFDQSILQMILQSLGMKAC